MASGKKDKFLQNRFSSTLKGILVYVLVAFVALIFFYNLSGTTPELGSEIPISEAVTDIKDGKVQKILVEGNKITLALKDSDKKLISRKEESESLYKILESRGIDPKNLTIEVKDSSMQQAWVVVLGAILPIVLMVGFFFLIFRQAKDAGQ